MTNPYAVLGLTPNATDEQIKDAYRKLATQYSETDYSTDPLGSVADRKMEELNAAYDRIMADRRAGGNHAHGDAYSQEAESYSSNQTNYGSGSSYRESASRNYSEIRMLIRSNDIFSAERRLMAIDASLRGAEWNFLMGCICQSKGWLDEAYRYFSSAHSMDPSNSEYTAAYNRMSRERRTGSSTYNPFGSQRSGGCLDDQFCSNAMQCMCMYSLCSSCCCGR